MSTINIYVANDSTDGIIFERKQMYVLNGIASRLVTHNSFYVW